MLSFRNGELLPEGTIKLDEEPAKWITVNGNRIPLNESGEAIGGNPKAFGGEKSSEHKSKKSNDRKSSGNQGKKTSKRKRSEYLWGWDDNKSWDQLNSHEKLGSIYTMIDHYGYSKKNGGRVPKETVRNFIEWADKDGIDRVENEIEKLARKGAISNGKKPG